MQEPPMCNYGALQSIHVHSVPPCMCSLCSHLSQVMASKFMICMMRYWLALPTHRRFRRRFPGIPSLALLRNCVNMLIQCPGHPSLICSDPWRLLGSKRQIQINACSREYCLCFRSRRRRFREHALRSLFEAIVRRSSEHGVIRRVIMDDGILYTWLYVILRSRMNTVHFRISDHEKLKRRLIENKHGSQHAFCSNHYVWVTDDFGLKTLSMNAPRFSRSIGVLPNAVYSKSAVL